MPGLSARKGREGREGKERKGRKGKELCADIIKKSYAYVPLTTSKYLNIANNVSIE